MLWAAMTSFKLRASGGHALIAVQWIRKEWCSRLLIPLIDVCRANEQLSTILHLPYVDFAGHQQLVNDVRFSPDTRYIASASFDKSVKLWDGKTGK